MKQALISQKTGQKTNYLLPCFFGNRNIILLAYCHRAQKLVREELPHIFLYFLLGKLIFALYIFISALQILSSRSFYLCKNTKNNISSAFMKK